jgi:hypothetical protein
MGSIEPRAALVSCINLTPGVKSEGLIPLPLLCLDGDVIHDYPFDGNAHRNVP